MSDEEEPTMLSTVDNPHSPFDHYMAWHAFDVAAGYNTAGLLAKVIATSEELSEDLQRRAYDQAVDEILEENVTGMFRRVKRSDFQTKTSSYMERSRTA